MSGIIAQHTLLSSGLIKSPAGGGAWNFISKQTADGDSTISFTSGIDDTYRLYLITYNKIHNNTDNGGFNFQCSLDSGSNYNIANTSTAFRAEHDEADSDTTLAYRGDDNFDSEQQTTFQRLIDGTGNASDESGAGFLQLFNPSSTTFVKHWMATSFNNHGANYEVNYYFAGYFNTTSAIDAIRFGTFSGTFDGDICLYGLTT